MGTKAFLACTQTEELVEGHCLIVPTQHTLTTLEGDDDVWDEIRVLLTRRVALPPKRLKLTVLTLPFPELHEDPHQNVCRAGQGRAILRDGRKL